MSDNFHDIIPPERRSIRNITSSHRRARRAPAAPAQKPSAPAEPEEEVEMRPSPPRGGRNIGMLFSRYGVWIVALVVLIIFVLAFSLLFSGSKVVVVPKQRDVVIDGQFVALQNAPEGVLSYELVTIERTASREVASTGDETVEERAAGQIIVFNDFNSSEQRLITNTRFETPEGLIYRIDGPIVVPGQRTVEGEVVPGSIEVTVYADEPGTSYNIGLTDFTIPGFEGSPRFDGFYARSKTPMSGGFVGTRLSIDEDTEDRIRSELRAELENELSSGTLVEEPPGLHLVTDTSFVSFESVANVDRADEVEVGEKAILSGILFSEEALGAFVAQNTVAGYEEGTPVAIADLDLLTFTLLADAEEVTPWEDGNLDFQLSGNAHLIWQFDEADLKQDLAGRNKDALPTILSGYEGIDKAEVSLRPFWKRSFPDNVEKIKVEQRLEE